MTGGESGACPSGSSRRRYSWGWRSWWGEGRCPEESQAMAGRCLRAAATRRDSPSSSPPRPDLDLDLGIGLPSPSVKCEKDETGKRTEEEWERASTPRFSSIRKWWCLGGGTGCLNLYMKFLEIIASSRAQKKSPIFSRFFFHLYSRKL